MRPQDHTDIGGVQEAFLTTHWSLIDGVRSSENEDGERALIDVLLKRYWKPVYCYLRRKGYDNEYAKDLSQGFFHEVVLGRDLFEKADPTKGRFRSFLLIALNRYLATLHAAENAQKRIPREKLVSLDMVAPSEFRQAASDFTPEESFDYAWVSALLERVLDEVETRCYEDGKGVHWHVFREKVLAPIMEGADSPAMGDLCQKYEIDDPHTASNMIITVKRRFRTILRNHLRETVVSDGEVDDELEQISQFLPRIAQSDE